ncbi:MAG: hypothetical protein IMZ53_13020 [Thermoplasmata archaeon]|nr:hypothetical protein [Thermoplasmata archaeon]
MSNTVKASCRLALSQFANDRLACVVSSTQRELLILSPEGTIAIGTFFLKK